MQEGSTVNHILGKTLRPGKSRYRKRIGADRSLLVSVIIRNLALRRARSFSHIDRGVDIDIRFASRKMTDGRRRDIIKKAEDITRDARQTPVGDSPIAFPRAQRCPRGQVFNGNQKFNFMSILIQKPAKELEAFFALLEAKIGRKWCEDLENGFPAAEITDAAMRESVAEILSGPENGSF
nr:probable indole-3-acetic acid-amido synthetase GH3.6 [Ipomoea batatas]